MKRTLVFHNFCHPAILGFKQSFSLHSSNLFLSTFSNLISSVNQWTSLAFTLIASWSLSYTTLILNVWFQTLALRYAMLTCSSVAHTHFSGSSLYHDLVIPKITPLDITWNQFGEGVFSRKLSCFELAWKSLIYIFLIWPFPLQHPHLCTWF